MKIQWFKLIRFITTIFLFDLLMTFVYLVIAYDSKEWDGMDNHSDDNFISKVINRLYYSVNVSTAFGLGPISPVSNLLKIITVVQIYVTLGIFLSKYNPLRL